VTALDYIVLLVYFLLMTGIGIASMLKVKKQEDFFLGSRTFGKLFQAFAAFGAGTGSYDPVTVGRTTFTSGLSGIWSVLLRLPTRVILPFVVVILLSLVTPGVDPRQLDRFYVKMKTRVDPDPEIDKQEARSIAAGGVQDGAAGPR